MDASIYSHIIARLEIRMDKIVSNSYSKTKSHFKSVTFALHVFRSLLKQFSSDFHEI